MSNKQEIKSVGLTESERFWALENLQETQRLPSIAEINLNYFGAEQCDPGFSFGPFTRTSYVLHFVRSGCGKLYVRERAFEIRAGQAFLLYPGEETVYQADQKDPWCYMWIGFHGLRAQEMMDKAGFTKEEPVITFEKMELLTGLMEQLLQAKELTYVNGLLRMGYLYQLMGTLIQYHSCAEEEHQESEDVNSMYVRTAINLLINSKDPHIKVSDVARTIGISRGYLTSIFRDKMGLSPQEFQINFRMERACDLLRFTDNPIGMIAAELGYCDGLAFSKSFRRHFGMSPTQYRGQKVILEKTKEKGSYTSAHPL